MRRGQSFRWITYFSRPPVMDMKTKESSVDLEILDKCSTFQLSSQHFSIRFDLFVLFRLFDLLALFDFYHQVFRLERVVFSFKLVFQGVLANCPRPIMSYASCRIMTKHFRTVAT